MQGRSCSCSCSPRGNTKAGRCAQGSAGFAHAESEVNAAPLPDVADPGSLPSANLSNRLNPNNVHFDRDMASHYKVAALLHTLLPCRLQPALAGHAVCLHRTCTRMPALCTPGMLQPRQGRAAGA